MFIVVSTSSDLLITFQASRNALFTVQEHPRLPNRLKLTVSRRRLPIATLQKTVEMDTAQREAKSLGEGSRVVHGCVRSMDTLGFPLREWRLLTISWSERNVSLNATTRPASDPHSSEMGHTFGLDRNRQWYVLYVSVVFLWTLPLLHRSATCTGTMPLWRTGR